METLLNCSLWGDEAFSALLAQKPLIPMLRIVAKDTSPPLFYLLSHFWFKIFGSSEIAIRSLSFLFYLATVLVVYLIGKNLYNRKTALLAALLTFLNPFLFFYAFEGRMYFSLLFFVLLSFYFLIKENQWGYILSATAALYSHHFAFLVLMTQFLWQFFKLISPRKTTLQKLINLGKPYLVIALFYLPWVYPLYQQTKLVAGGFWLGKPKLIDLFNIFINFIRDDAPVFWKGKIPLLVTVILLLRKWTQKEGEKSLFLISWATLPPLFAFLISQTKLSIFYERYLLYSIPPIMILLSSKTRKASFVFLATLLLADGQISYFHVTHPFKKPFRRFAQLVKSQLTPNIFLVNYNGKAHHLWESKYYHLQAPIYSPGGKLPFFVGTAQMTDQDIIKKLPPEKAIGLITSDPPEQIKLKRRQREKIHSLDSLAFILFSPEKKHD